MLMSKEIICPICDNVTSAMGGGIAGLWGNNECKHCHTLINFDTGMIADEEVDAEVNRVLGRLANPEEDYHVTTQTSALDKTFKPQGLLTGGANTNIIPKFTPLHKMVGEVATDEMAKMLTEVKSPFTVFSHHGTTESLSNTIAGFYEAFKPYADSAENLEAIIELLLRDQNFMDSIVTEDMKVAVEAGEMSQEQVRIIMLSLARKVFALQNEIKNKDRLINNYRRQIAARNEYRTKQENNDTLNKN